MKTEDAKHSDPASYSSMVYWREEAYKAREKLEAWRAALYEVVGIWGPGALMTVADFRAEVERRAAKAYDSLDRSSRGSLDGNLYPGVGIDLKGAKDDESPG